MKTTHYKIVSSTNDVIKTHLAYEEAPMMVTADFQTNGRGRRGRRWESSQGLNMLASFFHPAITQQNQALFISALSIVNTLKAYGVDAKIKLPNDIHINQKKIAGILIESYAMQSHYIIGVGLNVNQSFDSPKQTALADETGHNHDLTAIKDQFKKHVSQLATRSVENLFRHFKASTDMNALDVSYKGERVKFYDFDVSLQCNTSKGMMPCAALEFTYPKQQ